MTKDKALQMAINALTNCSNFEKTINACKEALEPEIKLADTISVEDYQSLRDWKHTIDERIARDSEFKEALEQPAQELEAYLRSALDNARDVCKYLDHDMVEKAKTHTQFFWDDLDKIRELDND